MVNVFNGKQGSKTVTELFLYAISIDCGSDNIYIVSMWNLLYSVVSTARQFDNSCRHLGLIETTGSPNNTEF